MLEHLGEAKAAERLMQAIETVTCSGETMPGDLGGKATTAEVTRAIIEALGAA
jgi:tartrate dehydrogenase/decarboxylase/D-malate dehydrogenase